MAANASVATVRLGAEVAYRIVSETTRQNAAALTYARVGGRNGAPTRAEVDALFARGGA